MFFSEKINVLLGKLESDSEKYWNIPREVAQMLYYLLRFSKAKRVLEVGTSSGYSGIWMAKALEQNGGALVTIESNEERFALASKNFKEADLKNVIQIKGHAPEVFPVESEISKGEFDLVFLDATKKQHIEFVTGVFPLIKMGGLIVVDNILSHWEVMSALVDFVELKDSLESQLVKVGDGVLLIYKRGELL